MKRLCFLSRVKTPLKAIAIESEKLWKSRVNRIQPKCDLLEEENERIQGELQMVNNKNKRLESELRRVSSQ